MESTIHKIDPNGDTLLILRNPNAPFAVGDASNSWPNVLPKYRTERMRRNELELIDIAHAEKSTTDSAQEVYFQLSSKHLTLASTYFQRLTANDWRETKSHRGFAYSVTAEDWDEAALLIVVNIIHCQTMELPQKVDLEMLAKVAVIVDYYQCHKAVGFYAELWTNNFEKKEIFNLCYGRNLLLRLFTSCVFSKAGDFRMLAEVIIRESRGPIHSLGLPFPQNIIDALEDERQKLISEIVSSLYTLVTELSTGSKTCSFECSSMSLGALVRGMKAMKLLQPTPASTFEGYSFMAMEKALRNIKQPDYSIVSHPASAHGTLYSSAQMRTCYLSERIKRIIVTQEVNILRLDLNGFIDTDKKT